MKESGERGNNSEKEESLKNLSGVQFGCTLYLTYLCQGFVWVSEDPLPEGRRGYHTTPNP